MSWWTEHRAGALVAYLDDRERARLHESCELVRAAGGDVILHAGSRARSVLFIEDGEVEVLGNPSEPAVLATMGPGAVVGEIGFVDGEPRTHSVRARTDCRMRRLTRERAVELFDAEPRIGVKFAVGLAEVVAARFRAALAELEPIRAFASTLDEPLDAEPGAGGGSSFDEIDEPLPNDALDIIRRVARPGGRELVDL